MVTEPVTCEGDIPRGCLLRGRRPLGAGNVDLGLAVASATEVVGGSAPAGGRGSAAPPPLVVPPVGDEAGLRGGRQPGHSAEIATHAAGPGGAVP